MLMILYPTKIHARNPATGPSQERKIINVNRIIVTIVEKFINMQFIV